MYRVFEAEAQWGGVGARLSRRPFLFGILAVAFVPQLSLMALVEEVVDLLRKFRRYAGDGAQVLHARP